MTTRDRANQNHVCPRTGRPVKASTHRWVPWLLPATGLASLIWFVVRVIPKPSRASYPCQRMAAPLASGFVLWLLGMVGSSLAYRRARRLLSQSRYLMAALCAAVAVAAVWWPLSITTSDTADAGFVPTEPPNSPMGVAKGIHAGRVVWFRDPAATRWDGSNGSWWDDDNTDQGVVDDMVSRTIRALTGSPTDVEAWDALFRYFNQTHGLGDIGHTEGETLAIKINMNQDAGDSWGPADGMPSPHVVHAVLDQLINTAGVPGSAITVYDASRYIGDPIYDKIRSNPDPNFQSVAFVVSPVVARDGRIGARHDPDHPIHTPAGVAYLPLCVTQATYLINLALLRPHELYGVTMCAKNHFGSVRFPSTSLYQGWTPSPLHDYGLRDNPMGSYNGLVELNGHAHLAGKTLLYFIDALYPAAHQGGEVTRFTSLGDDWFSSVLASQDPVAIDSVGLDILRSEPRCTNVTGNPDNYLHEMALADDPPSGTFYDPEQDGTRLASLGVHEHWNNAVEKLYSRNLGTGDGIELVVPSLTSQNGPVRNVVRDRRYDFIRHAVQEANDGDEIVVAQGTYTESLDFAGKALTVRSEDPNDPAVVAATAIGGPAYAVAFAAGEDANAVLAGFTLTDAASGIYCQNASPTIRNCRIVNNSEAGVKLWETDAAHPTFANCVIAGNGGAGVEMWSSFGRFASYNCATLLHCTIVGNAGQGIWGGDPIVVNSIIRANGDGAARQIDAHAATTVGCNIEGGYPGEGNIDALPGFVTPGFWALADDPEGCIGLDDITAVWVPGDNHLQQSSPCVDGGVVEPIFGWLTTDMDGDPRDVGDRPDIGCDEFVPAL